MQIGIVGSGFVGKAIATALLELHSISLTTTSRNKQKILQEQYPHVIVMRGEETEKYQELLPSCDLLIFCMAPKSREEYEKTYQKTAEALLSFVERENIRDKQLIYTSSTSVYSENSGGEVIETSPLASQDPHKKILIDTESQLLSLAKHDWKVCVFRCGGIYGNERRPFSLEGLKKGTLAGTGKEMTNAIHVEDIVRAVMFVIAHPLEGIYNLVDDDHPTRDALYRAAAEKEGLSPPKWDPSLPLFHVSNKIVSNEKIKSAGFSFLYPHRMLKYP